VVDALPEQAALAPVMPLDCAAGVAAQLIVHQLVELLAEATTHDRLTGSPVAGCWIFELAADRLQALAQQTPQLPVQLAHLREPVDGPEQGIHQQGGRHSHQSVGRAVEHINPVELGVIGHQKQHRAHHDSGGEAGLPAHQPQQGHHHQQRHRQPHPAT
jgi:hypothetical protein